MSEHCCRHAYGLGMVFPRFSPVTRKSVSCVLVPATSGNLFQVSKETDSGCRHVMKCAYSQRLDMHYKLAYTPFASCFLSLQVAMQDEKSAFQVVIMERREGEFKALQKEKERRLEELRYRRTQEREVSGRQGAGCVQCSSS